MEKTFLVITSIAGADNSVLKQISKEAQEHKVPFIVIGDTKSPSDFKLEGCDFYSIEKQKSLSWTLAEKLPYKHYARKNLGYLVAASQGAEVIVETDDDNLPYKSFWQGRKRSVNAHLLTGTGWTNVYKYFTEHHIWPRGFALEHLLNTVPSLAGKKKINCVIQQGLADDNPDVDAIYRMTLPLPVKFNQSENIVLGENSICPFNSQNTTWFKEAFPLLYLPSYCSFRMTDIWRSFVAQRIAWACGWNILFHAATMYQERNEHNLMNDFKDEIPGYLNNKLIMERLHALKLKDGTENIPENLLACYKELIGMELIGKEELPLVQAWIKDIGSLI
jgi:STELLO glycosyltransferases